MADSKRKRIISEVDPKYNSKDWRQKKLRVAAYARVSTDSKDQENSLKNQREYYEKFIPQHANWEYIGIFSDDGISGTSVRNRTGFREMIEACKAGSIDLIVIKDVSRFARNTTDCLNTVQELLTLDPPVGIYFENNNLNTLEAGNKVILTVLAMFAELDSELKSGSVRFGLQVIFDRGDYLCPTQNLLGYKKDGKYRMVIEPQGAKTVRLIYDLFLSGYSKKEIASILTELALPTAKGNLVWSTAAVSGICRNERYCGDIIMQKSYTVSFLTHQTRRNVGQRRLYYEPEHHEGIVSREEHARALLLLKANHESPFFNHEYEIKVIKRGLLAGFIPMNPAFGGYDAGHYLGALVMAQIRQIDIESEVAYITGAKRVRRELFGGKDTAVVTISSHGLLFNTGCVSLLKNTEYVEVLLHPGERLLAVRGCGRRNKNVVPWSGKAIPAKELSGVLFDLMGWRKSWKYKSTANCFTKNDEQILLFDLSCCEFHLPPNDRGERPARAVPSDWLSKFGEALPEYMMLCRRALANVLDDWQLDVPASAIQGFTSGIKSLSRKEAERRISEMRDDDGHQRALRD